MRCRNLDIKFNPSPMQILLLVVIEELIFICTLLAHEYIWYGSVTSETLQSALLPALILFNVITLPVLVYAIGHVTWRTVIAIYCVIITVVWYASYNGIVPGSTNSRTMGRLEDSFYTSIKHYHSNTEIRNKIDHLQNEYKCCGVERHTDWLYTLWYRNQSDASKRYPESCCTLNPCSYTKDDPNLNKRGCFNLINASDLQSSVSTSQLIILTCIVILVKLGVIVLKISRDNETDEKIQNSMKEGENNILFGSTCADIGLTVMSDNLKITL